MRALGEVALAAAGEAAPALERKDLLPVSWVQQLEDDVRLSRLEQQGMRALVQSFGGGAGAGPAFDWAANLRTVVDAEQAVQQELQAQKLGTKCDGCGQAAVGRRRCSACKGVQYCRCVVGLASCARWSRA